MSFSKVANKVAKTITGNSKTKEELRDCIDQLQRTNIKLQQTVKSLTEDLQNAKLALQSQQEYIDSSDAAVLTTIVRLETSIHEKQSEIEHLYKEINDIQSKLIHNPPELIENIGTRNPGVQAYEDGTNPPPALNIYACQKLPLSSLINDV